MRATKKIFVYSFRTLPRTVSGRSEESNTKNMHTREEKLQAFGRILDILDELREKCPWDRKQTNESLRPQTIEEVYELSDAILKGEEMNCQRNLETCCSM